jgi:hypothetical protein
MPQPHRRAIQLALLYDYRSNNLARYLEFRAFLRERRSPC